jgi:hypothetical protein
MAWFFQQHCTVPKGNQVNIPEPGLGIFSLAATQLNLETPAGALGRVFFSF